MPYTSSTNLQQQPPQHLGGGSYHVAPGNPHGWVASGTISSAPNFHPSSHQQQQQPYTSPTMMEHQQPPHNQHQQHHGQHGQSMGVSFGSSRMAVLGSSLGGGGQSLATSYSVNMHHPHHPLGVMGGSSLGGGGGGYGPSSHINTANIPMHAGGAPQVVPMAAHAAHQRPPHPHANRTHGSRGEQRSAGFGESPGGPANGAFPIAFGTSRDGNNAANVDALLAEKEKEVKEKEKEKAQHLYRNLYLSGLPQSLGDEDLKEFFSQYGKVESAKVMIDVSTGLSRGFAFVLFSKVEEGCAAFGALNGKDVTVKGETFTVKMMPSEHDGLSATLESETIYVRNIPAAIPDADAKAHFAKFGPVVSFSLRPIHPGKENKRLKQQQKAAAAAAAASAEGPAADDKKNENTQTPLAAATNITDASHATDISDRHHHPLPLVVLYNMATVEFETVEQARAAIEGTHYKRPWGGGNPGEEDGREGGEAAAADDDNCNNNATNRPPSAVSGTVPPVLAKFADVKAPKEPKKKAKKDVFAGGAAIAGGMLLMPGPAAVHGAAPAGGVVGFGGAPAQSIMPPPPPPPTGAGFNAVYTSNTTASNMPPLVPPHPHQHPQQQSHAHHPPHPHPSMLLGHSTISSQGMGASMPRSLLGTSLPPQQEHLTHHHLHHAMNAGNTTATNSAMGGGYHAGGLPSASSPLPPPQQQAHNPPHQQHQLLPLAFRPGDNQVYFQGVLLLTASGALIPTRVDQCYYTTTSSTNTAPMSSATSTTVDGGVSTSGTSLSLMTNNTTTTTNALPAPQPISMAEIIAAAEKQQQQQQNHPAAAGGLGSSVSTISTSTSAHQQQQQQQQQPQQAIAPQTDANLLMNLGRLLSAATANNNNNYLSPVAGDNNNTNTNNNNNFTQLVSQLQQLIAAAATSSGSSPHQHPLQQLPQQASNNSNSNATMQQQHAATSSLAPGHGVIPRPAGYSPFTESEVWT